MKEYITGELELIIKMSFVINKNNFLTLKML